MSVISVRLANVFQNNRAGGELGQDAATWERGRDTCWGLSILCGKSVAAQGRGGLLADRK